MRNLGITLLILGSVGALVALNLDTSVSTGFGQVNNIGLMNDRQNYLIASCFIALIGVILFVADRSSSSQSQQLTQNGESKLSATDTLSPLEQLTDAICTNDIHKATQLASKIDFHNLPKDKVSPCELAEMYEHNEIVEILKRYSNT